MASISVSFTGKSPRAIRSPSPSHEFLLALATQFEAAVLVTTPDLRVVVYTPRARELFEFLPDEVLGRPLSSLDASLPVSESLRLSSLAEKCIASSQACKSQAAASSKSGVVLNLQVNALAVRDQAGSLLGVLLVLHKLPTEQRGDRLLPLTSRQKGSFLTMMSHELRTPLTSIIGYTDLLIRGLGGALPQRAVGYLNHVRSASHRLLGIVEGLLNYTQLEAGMERLLLHPVEIERAITEAIENIHSDVSRKQLTIHRISTLGKEAVVADEAKLQQILGAFLSNAVKFTPQRGAISVTSEIDPTAAHMARIGIRDSGMGLSEEQLSRVWERFYQADSSLTRPHGGIGLGLAIAGHLAELHGGRVWAESPGLGQGATFWLALPRFQPRS